MATKDKTEPAAIGRCASRFILLACAMLTIPLAHASAEALVRTAPERTGMHKVADASGSAIEGRVSIRPVRSVERRGAANSEPYSATIAVLDTAGREVASAKSDADGRFRLQVPPGTYVLRPQSSGMYPRAGEQKVVVRPNAVTQVEIVYDSGRR